MATLTASPTTAANGTDLGEATWTSPENVLADDGSYATIALDGIDGPFSSEYLECGGFDFNGVPSGATIDGFTVTIRAFSAGPTHSSGLFNGQLYKVGTGWSDLFNPTVGIITGTEAAVTMGGATDLCNTTWTRTQALDAAFAVRFSTGSAGGPETMTIDNVTVTVHYTAAGGGDGKPSTIYHRARMLR